jgi:hypothetical protein
MLLTKGSFGYFEMGPGTIPGDRSIVIQILVNHSSWE